MTEDYILQMIPKRIEQLGYHNYQIRYRDFTLKANSALYLRSFNELWYVSGDPPGIVIDSYYGMYDSTGNYVHDNTHEHRGEITITNPDNESKRIKFIQVIIVN